MAWKKNCGLLIGCLALAHVVVIRTTPVDPLAKEAQWCNRFVSLAERSPARVISGVRREGSAYGHALARALIAHITEKSIHCRSLAQRMRIAISLYNLRLIKERLDLEVYQQASCPVPTCVGAGRFILYQRPVG